MSKISHRIVARVLNSPVRTPSLRNRVIHRYANVADNVATEFSSPEAMKDYLHNHPGADPKNVEATEHFFKVLSKHLGGTAKEASNSYRRT